MREKVKAYKGFEVITVYNEETETFEDVIECKGFRFKEGKTYEESEASLCRCGFHACTYPLDVFNYYYTDRHTVGKIEYHVVELEDVSSERENDSKICAKKITIGKKITPVEMVEISKAFPAEPIEGMNKRNLTSCFFIEEDVTKAEPIIRNAVVFPYSSVGLTYILDYPDWFSYYRLSDGKFELVRTEVYLLLLENYSFWTGVPTQEELESYYRCRERG